MDNIGKAGIIFILLVLFLTGASVKSRLESVKGELARKRKELASLQKEEKGIVNELASLDREISLREEIISDLATEESLIVVELDTLRVALRNCEEEVKKQKELLAKLLVYTYQKGKLGELAFIFSGESFSEILKRVYFLKLLALARKEKVRSVVEQSLKMAELIAEREKNLAELKSVRQEREQELALLRASKGERAKALASIRSREDEYRNAIARLETSKKELEKLLQSEVSRASRGSGAQEGESFAGLKGRLPWPLAGKRQILRGFGITTDSRYGTKIENSGIDIRANPGEPVFAVYQGELVYSGWLQGYDYVVIMKHPGNYYTVYGNLGKVNFQKGARVRSKDTLGHISSTGWLDGPKLHFEIRFGKKEVNPLEWLAKR